MMFRRWLSWPDFCICLGFGYGSSQEIKPAEEKVVLIIALFVCMTFM